MSAPNEQTKPREYDGRFPPDTAAALKVERDALRRAADRVLGAHVRDMITGFAGICTATTTTMFGDWRAMIEHGKTDKFGGTDTVIAEWFDLKRVEITSGNSADVGPAVKVGDGK